MTRPPVPPARKSQNPAVTVALVFGGVLLISTLFSRPSSSDREGTAVAPPPGTITQEAFGEDWPFVYSAGVLRCEGQDGFGAVTFTPATASAQTYAVNGVARGQAAARGWNDEPFSIVRDGGNIGPIIQRALQDCR